jgi:hypothetical protein
MPEISFAAIARAMAASRVSGARSSASWATAASPAKSGRRSRVARTASVRVGRDLMEVDDGARRSVAREPAAE